VTTIDNTDPTELRGRIVALSTTEWHDDQWMNRQHICSRLAARGWRVVYSNGALRLDGWRSMRWNRAPWFDRVETQENLRIVHAGRLDARIDRVAPLARRAIRRHAETLIDASGGRPDWILVFNARLADYIQHFDDVRVAYHVYDYVQGYPTWNPFLEKTHSHLVDRADLLTASSARIAETLPNNGPDGAIVIPNGADTRAFEAGVNALCPPDIAAIPRPRIIYAGKLNEKVDYSLIAGCASKRPRHQWLLVGSEGRNIDDLPHLKKLRQLPNVHFLGERHHSRIPAYVGHSDVVALAYSIEGGWARFGSPLKLFEGLAAGKSVVSAPLDAVKPFANVTALASTPEEWLDALDAAIAGQGVGSPEERRRAAREHDWEGWVDRYEALLRSPPERRTRLMNAHEMGRP
jgi:glycosyltransferase involved in cell wall biosynthesis